MNTTQLMAHWLNHGLKENRSDNKIISNFNPIGSEIILFTNARDEDLKEWCQHHLSLGFDRIYIFDHLSKDPLQKVLHNFDPRVQTMSITIKHSIKMTAIDYALNICKSIGAKWMLYLDADEFLVLNQNDTIQEYIASYPPDASLISMNWLMFGTSNLIKQPESIIENFIYSDKNLHHLVKSLVKVNDVASPYTPHTYRLKNGNYYNNKKNMYAIHCELSVSQNFKETDAFIAHYFYQSEEIYLKRRSRQSDLGYSYSNLQDIHTKSNDILNTHVRDHYSKKINV